jgi:hypothetical protein
MQSFDNVYIPTFLDLLLVLIFNIRQYISTVKSTKYDRRHTLIRTIKTHASSNSCNILILYEVASAMLCYVETCRNFEFRVSYNSRYRHYNTSDTRHNQYYMMHACIATCAADAYCFCLQYQVYKFAYFKSCFRHACYFRPTCARVNNIRLPCRFIVELNSNHLKFKHCPEIAIFYSLHS